MNNTRLLNQRAIEGYITQFPQFQETREERLLTVRLIAAFTCWMYFHQRNLF